MHRKRSFVTLFVALMVAALVAATPLPGGADHAKDHGEAGEGNDDFYYEHHAQHGPSDGHLPGSSENVELVGKLGLTQFEGDISDVSALPTADGRWFAYLGDWGAQCNTGGVHVVDITDPENPQRSGFLNSGGFGYVTEGVQALHVETTAFGGDLLVISNEWCRGSGNPKNMPGGITLWDVTEPTEPKRLVQAFGDFDVHGNRANESHSAIAWNAGDRAFLAAIDNEELADVDLFEITDPRNPVLLAETRLPGVSVNGYGQLKTSHDFDVLQFPDGSWHLMVSDWDAGWIDVDVTDPENPVIAGDFDYAECDQVVATACPPEGNAHQGEWNGDGTLFLGTDEDFSPFRTPITVLDGDMAGEKVDAGEFGWTKQVASFPDEKINGPTVFGGYGCVGDRAGIPAATDVFPAVGADEERIIVFQRGPVNDPNSPGAACFFSDKVASGEMKGYDVVLIANHHDGAQGGETPGSFICGGQGSAVAGTAAGLCVGHEFMHEAFGRTPDYTIPYPSGDPGDLEPDIGDLGPTLEASAEFDGWGYVRLIDSTTMTEIDQLTIPESADPEFAAGFGDLTVHEVEIARGDPNEGGSSPDDGVLAYFSWYSGGFRVASFDGTGIQEVGHYIDPDGNNFWGVALAKDQNGDRIVLASDRDFGLFIFRYTGSIPSP
ncbi:MAG: hypothetical protein HY658_00760 [Actinobacteria bacterium]|nr:hypothetical protein [Actinomycetota bacterium]